jgi:type II secretory pathway component PulJ
MRNYINQNGFSLMSTIVATGLVGALSLGVMRLLDQGYKGSSDLNARQELRDIRDQILMARSRE